MNESSKEKCHQDEYLGRELGKLLQQPNSDGEPLLKAG